jgi:hypothetical protein
MRFMFAFYGGVRSAVCIIASKCTMPIFDHHNIAMVNCIVEGIVRSWILVKFLGPYPLLDTKEILMGFV